MSRRKEGVRRARLYGRCGRGAGLMELRQVTAADLHRAPQPPQDDYRVGLTAPPRDTRPQTEVCQLAPPWISS